MAEAQHKAPSSSLLHTQLTTIFRWVQRPRVLLRRRRMRSVRLGGKRPRPRLLLARRTGVRVGLRWAKLKYSGLLRKLKQFYVTLTKDLLVEDDDGSFKPRLLIEASFSIPVTGMAFASFPSSSSSSRSDQPLPINV